MQPNNIYIYIYSEIQYLCTPIISIHSEIQDKTAGKYLGYLKTDPEIGMEKQIFLVSQLTIKKRQ